MENRAHALAAGFFVILLGIAAVAVAMWLSGDNVMRDSYLVVSEGSVSGLNPQAAVRYRGVDVGKVEDIRFDPQDPHYILIRITVDQSVALTKGAFARLGYQGVTGLAHVQLDDDGKQPERLQAEADHLARIPMRPSLMDKITDSGQELLSNVNETAKRVNLLLNDHNQMQFERILQNVESATGRLDRLAGRLQPEVENLAGLAGETRQVLQQTNQLLTGLNQLTAQAGQDGVIGRLSRGAEEFADILPGLREASVGVARSSRNLDRVLLQLEEHPRSLLFDKPPPPPGPGEDGFVPPPGAAR